MKKRKVGISLIALSSMALFSCGGGGNVFEGLADKNSYEACRFEVSQNLDKGNYDAVLSSSCANPLDKGAAYFGKAGFDIKDVIDRLIEQQGSSDTADTYIKALVPEMNPDKYGFLDSAVAEYSKLSNNDDAKFYLSLVSAMKALSTMKSVIGEIKTECDLNNNDKPDDVDATVCMFERVSNNNSVSPNSTGTCSAAGIPYSTSTALTFSTDTTTTYLGIVFTFSGSQEGCLNQYKKLYYKTSTGTYQPATTVGECEPIGVNEKWPCPYAQKKDLVENIQENLDQAVNLITELLGNKNPDLKKSIEELRQEVCGTDGVCSTDEIKNYINKIKK